MNAGLHFPDIFSRLLVQSTILAQHACFGDGGLLCAMLTCQLVLQTIEDAGDMHAVRLQYVAAFQRILGWVSDLLPGSSAVTSLPACSSGRKGSSVLMNLSMREAGIGAYVAVVQNVLNSKQVPV
jgi:hypothetical protein